jgi:hypothetical protein
MDNLLFFIIIIGLILIIYYIHHTAPKSKTNLLTESENKENKENFDIFPNQDNLTQCAGAGQGDVLTLNPYTRCELMGKKKFMVRDLRTQLWLISGQTEGFNKFLPGRFGNVFMMSDNPDEYLPLRTISNPNDYLLATHNGNGIRTVSNPYNQYFIIQVFIYNGFNVLGWISESNVQLYLFIDSDGHITSHTDPESASKVEILEV